MDTTTIITVPVLSAIGGWFGSYMQGYMSQKGKNLATHEDIDKLVEQVKAVTQTTKEIEAKISDQVWDRQRRWELKRDLILKISDQVSIAKEALVLLDARTPTYRENRMAPEDYRECLFSFVNKLDELDRLAITSSLVCDRQIQVAVSNYTSILRVVATQFLEKDIRLDFNVLHEDIPVKFSAVVAVLKDELT
jgi:hypothetical protein